METLGNAYELMARGCFTAAMCCLERLPVARMKTLEAETLRVELLERSGRFDEAEELSRRLLRNRTMSDTQRSVCEFSIGMVLWEKGETGAGVEYFQRAVASAEKGNDLWRTCWAQLRLFVSLSGKSSSLPGSRLFRELRQNIIRLGDPVVSAALHVFLGELEAKRGLFATSCRHTALGQSLLKRSSNIWLEALAENNWAALSIMQFDLDEGLSHAKRAIELSEASGAAAALRAGLANLGNLHSLRGDLDTARALLKQSLSSLPSAGEHSNGVLDELARTFIAENRFDEADELLHKIETSIRGQGDRTLYSSRHALLSRAELLMRMARWEEARSVITGLVEIATSVGDRTLRATALARRARIVATIEGSSRAIPDLTALAELLIGEHCPSHHVRYELAVQGAMNLDGPAPGASSYLKRATTICQTLGCETGLLMFELGSTGGGSCNDGEHPASARPQPLQDIASLLMHAGRPELLAAGLIAVLQHTEGITAARAVARATDNAEQEVGSCGTWSDATPIRTFNLGTSRGRTVELRVQAPLDVESQATVNSVGFIVAAALELERARLEREERQTLWPVDELPAEDDDSVVAGKMRDVMIYARKIAQANVTVLVTGESGTGKEVLARAVHRYSTRSKKPFIPFNCTAVPRDLLESHLFGFKRGAFTGADRDNQGLIRAAKDGTLFLDEIGELGLDLQPKLLRFIESGEIHPLGEASPFSVNVRIVAATNADLQRLVAEGRFREDLYYRLNVIPIALPPLRERREEIAPLAQHFALKWSHELGKGCIRVADDLMEHLVLYPWPGNIRQLSNEIHRMVAVAETSTPLTLDHMPRALRVETEMLKRKANGLEMAVSLTDRLDRAVSTVEREMIKVALRTSNGRVDPAAKSLGISRKGLYLKRQRFGL